MMTGKQIIEASLKKAKEMGFKKESTMELIKTAQEKDRLEDLQYFLMSNQIWTEHSFYLMMVTD